MHCRRRTPTFVVVRIHRTRLCDAIHPSRRRMHSPAAGARQADNAHTTTSRHMPLLSEVSLPVRGILSGTPYEVLWPHISLPHERRISICQLHLGTACWRCGPKNYPATLMQTSDWSKYTVSQKRGKTRAIEILFCGGHFSFSLAR